MLMILLTNKLMTGFPLVGRDWGGLSPILKKLVCPPSHDPLDCFPPKMSSHSFWLFCPNCPPQPPPTQVDPIKETLDDTAPYTRFEHASELWQ